MNRGEGKVVCVTGASGYIASWLVKLLLDRRYTVNGTVRSLNDPRKTEHLLALDGAKERLHLFEADLIKEADFDSIVYGCDAVFHTASPVSFSVNNPQLELVDPAVKGTLNVLRSCAKAAASVKRVVITSSMVSVVFNGKQLNPNVEVDETWFSDPTFCENSKQWYVLSKTLAEEEAWKFAKEKGIDLVAVNPGCVIGPLLQPTLNLTCEGILDLIKSAEKEDFSEGNSPFVDVRDVAYAHIQAFEIPSATGRYCLVETVAYYSEILKILHELYPSIRLPKKFEEEMPIVPPYKVSKQRAKTLGINFIPLEVSLKDTVESLKEKNLLCF